MKEKCKRKFHRPCLPKQIELESNRSARDGIILKNSLLHIVSLLISINAASSRCPIYCPLLRGAQTIQTGNPPVLA
jgi:hypothetical protein